MIAIVWAVAIGFLDLSTRRIPNVLTLGAMVAGLVAWFFKGTSPLGAGGVSMALGLALALLITLPGYLARQLGAGDVKFLSAVALLGGAQATLVTFVFGAVVAGGIAGAWLLLGPRFGLPPPRGKHLPFGAALALGFAASMLIGQAGRMMENASWLR